MGTNQCGALKGGHVVHLAGEAGEAGGRWAYLGVSREPGRLEGLEMLVEGAPGVEGRLEVGLAPVGAEEERLGPHHVRVVDPSQGLDLTGLRVQGPGFGW